MCPLGFVFERRGWIWEPDRRRQGGISIMALLNRLDTVTASERTSVSAVAEAGIGVSSGTNRGGA
jgi:hypothetical protein